MNYTAEHVFLKETKISLRNTIQQLKEISVRSPDGNKPPTPKLIKDVYLLFQKESNNEYADLISKFTKKDVKILVWALDYKPENDDEIILFSNKLEIALSIIKDKWKDAYIISLWHILLKNWDDLLITENQLPIMFEFLKTKCNEYNKSRKDILNAVSNMDLFLRKDSAKEYAARLIKRKTLFREAHKLIDQKESILIYEYYSSVLEKYIELIDIKVITNEALNSVYEFLRFHKNMKITLLSCSQIINSNKFDHFIEIIKNQTVSLIGDPIIDYHWRFNGLSTYQEEYIASARKKLNILLNQHFIKVFFEVLVQDKRRKDYWLNFINNIDDIKFVGTQIKYHLLKNIESISEYVDARFKITTKQYQIGTCALLIYSRNYVFVEFSDIGALYIYKRKNFRFNLNAITGVDNLKIWSKSDYALKYSETPGVVYKMKEEGKINHQGNWEGKLNRWMDAYFHHSVLDPNELANIKYVKDNSEMQWESDGLHWCKKKLPGYSYSFSKKAFFKA